MSHQPPPADPTTAARRVAVQERIAVACLDLAAGLEQLAGLLASCSPTVASMSRPVDDADGALPPSAAASDPDPDPGSDAAPLDHPAIRSVVDSLRLRVAIRNGLDVLWPGDRARQADWLRSYLQPRGHTTLGLAGLTVDELQVLADHIETLVDRLRRGAGTPPRTADR